MKFEEGDIVFVREHEGKVLKVFECAEAHDGLFLRAKPGSVMIMQRGKWIPDHSIMLVFSKKSCSLASFHTIKDYDKVATI